MTSSWKHIEARWPGKVGGCEVSFATLKRDMESLLAGLGIAPRAFSHFGIVVSDIEKAMTAIVRIVGSRLDEVRKDWVQAYAVYVSRGHLEGIELEFVQPAGASFFADHLAAEGEGLHHLSFRVDDIGLCAEILEASEAVRTDYPIRDGSHGRILFVEPETFQPLFLELCEPRAQGTVGG